MARNNHNANSAVAFRGTMVMPNSYSCTNPKKVKGPDEFSFVVLYSHVVRNSHG